LPLASLASAEVATRLSTTTIAATNTRFTFMFPLFPPGRLPVPRQPPETRLRELESRTRRTACQAQVFSAPNPPTQPASNIPHKASGEAAAIQSLPSMPADLTS